VFAGGVNPCKANCGAELPLAQVFQRLNPDYVLPRLRKSLIFELATAPEAPNDLEGELHFVEYGSKALRLEMCSLLPKRGSITVVLVEPSIEASTGAQENLEIIRRFLELPHENAFHGFPPLSTLSTNRVLTTLPTWPPAPYSSP